MLALEAAAGGGQGEGALDLVAGAHAAPARDAQLVPEGEVGVALVVAPACCSPGQRGSPTPSMPRDRGQLGVLGRAPRAARRAPARRRRAATRRAVGVARVDLHARRGTGVVQAGTGPGAPSTPTRQTRHAPNGAWRSSKQSVGIQRPPARAASSIVVAVGRPRPRSPSTVDRDHSRAPAPRGSARAGCGSAPACRRRARTGCRARAPPAAASRRARSTGPPCGEHRRGRGAGPIRHGKHLPQLSSAPKCSRCLATARMSVGSSKATIQPWPTMQPSAASGVEVEGGVELDARAGCRRAGRRSAPP